MRSLLLMVVPCWLGMAGMTWQLTHPRHDGVKTNPSPVDVMITQRPSRAVLHPSVKVGPVEKVPLPYVSATRG